MCPVMMMRMMLILLQSFVIIWLERYLLHCHNVSCLVVDRSVNFSKVTLTCDHDLDNDDQHPSSGIGNDDDDYDDDDDNDDDDDANQF